MMGSSEQWDGLNAANRPRGRAYRCILAEREVGPDLIVIVGMGLQHIPEMPFANYRPIGESDSICDRHNGQNPYCHGTGRTSRYAQPQKGKVLRHCRSGQCA